MTETSLWLESCEQERESSPVGDSICGRPCPRSCTTAAWSLRPPSEYRALRAQAQVHRTLRNYTTPRCTSTCWTATASIDGRPGRSRGYPNISAVLLNLIVGNKQGSENILLSVVRWWVPTTNWYSSQSHWFCWLWLNLRVHPYLVKWHHHR